MIINYKNKTQTSNREQLLVDKDCWFCFCNQIARHLIFFESENFYCALPKGPVVDEHFLVVPKQHIPNQVQVINDESLREEYLKVKNMVISYLSK